MVLRDAAPQESMEPSGHPFRLVEPAERSDSWPADAWRLGGTRSEALLVDAGRSAALRDALVVASAWRLEVHSGPGRKQQGSPKSSCVTAAASAALGASRVPWRSSELAVGAGQKGAESAP